MSSKRQQRDDEGSSFDDKRPKKFPTFKSVVLDVMTMHKLQTAMEPVMEPLIRRVVKQEVETALRKYIITMKRNCGKEMHTSKSESLKLQFSNAPSLPVFTGTRIEGEGCTNMEVSLVDALTGEVVSSGLGSSSKVEILVLEGDFDGDEGDNWTVEDFTNNIVREREGKKALLIGDVNLTLKDGIGMVGDLSFTDNSSWTRSRKFRLAARLMDNPGGIRVREARSEPFVVRDHRGELYKKHHPPFLSDEVWRLEKIGKGGAFHKRLRKERVNTVQDFLRLFFLNPSRLRHILGTGMSGKMWEVTTEHARTCVLDSTLYVYDASTPPQKNGVIFNVVGQVMGMFSNGQYVAGDKLSEAENANARELIISAFGNTENIVTLNDVSSLKMPSSSFLPNSQPSLKFLSEVGNHQDLNIHKTERFTCSQQDASSQDYMHSVYSVGGIDDYLHSIDLKDIGYDQPLGLPGQISDICITDSITQELCANERMQYFDRDFSLQTPNISADLHDAINAFIPCSVVPVDKAPTRWDILLSVLRWCFSMKRIVARKTRVREITNRW